MRNTIARLPDGQLVAEIELAYEPKTSIWQRNHITRSQDAYDTFMSIWDMKKIHLQEQFKVMLLDKRHGCIGIATIATGGISSCIADLRLAFGTALKAAASSIILAHNHPSGNRVPSEQDKTLTKKFAGAGHILDIPVLDHLIVTKEGYTSLADEGLDFKT